MRYRMRGRHVIAILQTGPQRPSVVWSRKEPGSGARVGELSRLDADSARDLVA